MSFSIFSHFTFGTSLVSLNNIIFFSIHVDNNVDSIMIHLPFSQIKELEYVIT